MDTQCKVISVSATIGGNCDFLLRESAPTKAHVLNNTKTVQSSSLIIQATMISAFLTNSMIELEFFTGSNTIKRVKGFAVGDGSIAHLDGEHQIREIATQRSPEEPSEHLEVSIYFGSEKKIYNVYDPFLQQVLQAAFRIPNNSRVHLGFETNNTSISSVRLGVTIK